MIKFVEQKIYREIKKFCDKKKSNENQKKVVLKEIDRKYIKSHYCNSKQNEIFVME